MPATAALTCSRVNALTFGPFIVGLSFCGACTAVADDPGCIIAVDVNHCQHPKTVHHIRKRLGSQLVVTHFGDVQRYCDSSTSPASAKSKPCLARLAARLASSQISLLVTRIIAYAFNRLSRRLAMGTRPGLLRGAIWTKRRCQKRPSAKSSSRQPSNRRAGTSPLGTRHHQRMTFRLDGSGDQHSASIHDQPASSIEKLRY